MATTTQVRNAIRAAAKSLKAQLSSNTWTDAPGNNLRQPKRYVCFKVYESLPCARKLAAEANALLLLSTGEQNAVRATVNTRKGWGNRVGAVYIRANATL